jgi:hypothetical protein
VIRRTRPPVVYVISARDARRRSEGAYPRPETKAQESYIKDSSIWLRTVWAR